MAPDRDISRLPKWAQNEIKRLTRDVEILRERLEAGPENSDTFADAYSETMRPLGQGPVIEFRFGPQWGQRFHARLEGERLYISGGSSIVVHPRASNLVEVEVIR